MINVAIIVENKTVRESLEIITNLAADCRCVGAWSEIEPALRMMAKRKPDVVLLDVQTPNMDGGDCTARIKALLPPIQIIMLTLYEDPDRILHTMRAGAWGYLLKRSTPEQIVAGIRAAHHARGATREPAARHQNSPLGELGRTANAATLAGEL